MATRPRCPRLPFLALAALPLWAVVEPARAENPKVSLKVVDVTPAEAIARLSSASGIRVDLPASQPFGGAGLSAADQKVSFDWTDMTFARALRQFCEKYNLRPNRRPGGY